MMGRFRPSRWSIAAAAMGRENRDPWPIEQPTATSVSLWATVSMPSATVWSESASLRFTILRTMPRPVAVSSSCTMNDRSIFSTSTGNCCK